jgi:hypothetical protein
MRPKDDNGFPLKPPHVRLDDAPKYEQAAIFAISADARVAHLTLARKLTLVRKAIDHVWDGDAAPAWVKKTDKEMPENDALWSAWRTAVSAIKAARAA